MAYVRALGSGKDRRRMPSADVPSAERSNGDKLSAATSICRLNSMISPLELIDSTTECRALCMEKHGMPVRPIMAMAACAVLVTQGRAPAGGRLGTSRATGTESQNSKLIILSALTPRFSWARSRRTVPIFALSESVPQTKGWAFYPDQPCRDASFFKSFCRARATRGSGPLPGGSLISQSEARSDDTGGARNKVATRASRGSRQWPPSGPARPRSSPHTTYKRRESEQGDTMEDPSKRRGRTK